MSSSRNNGTPQGRPPLRTQPVAGRNTASPLTPRLAVSANPIKRDPSPRRPFVKTASTSRGPSPEKSSETPLRSATADVVTTKSSVRVLRSRPGSTVSTPGTNTPGSVRARSTFPSPRTAGPLTPSDKDGQFRGPARSNALQNREGSTLSPLSQDPIMSFNPNIEDVVIKNPSSMFFHADEARSHDPPPPVAAPVKKVAGFFYANGQREEPAPARLLRSVSPALSMFAEKRPLSTVGSRVGASEVDSGSRQAMKSPTLSAISFARSPFVASPPAAPSPQFRSQSPPKTDYLNTPNATINYNRVRNERTYFESPTPLSPMTPMTPMTDGLGVTMDPTQRPSASDSPRSHVKSASVNVAATDSPSSARKRSATWAENKFEHSPVPFSLGTPLDTTPALPRTNTASSLTSPIVSDPLQSPSRELYDFAAGARRERKVLDLEISNSSLLAINRSLEREIKKHKAELKRYRRLSRAGRFSVAPSGLGDDEGFHNALPHVDGGLVGRPSSPFQEDVSDMELSDENTSEDEEEEEGPTSPDAKMSKEERQRAKDEAQLRNDMRKHRDLLLDTARMNRSLQRCLTWTEDLIKDGKKALDHHVPSSEVRLGGRVLEADEGDDDEEAAEEDDVNDAALLEDEDDMKQQRQIESDFEDIQAFLGMSQRQENARVSDGSEGTNRDSGVELEKTTSRQQQPLPLHHPHGF